MERGGISYEPIGRRWPSYGAQDAPAGRTVGRALGGREIHIAARTGTPGASGRGSGTVPVPGQGRCGCDALVLGLHGSTCRVGAGALGCAVIRAKGGGEQGRAYMVLNARLETRRPKRPVYSSRLVPLKRSQRARTRRANYRPVQPRESPIRT